MPMVITEKPRFVSARKAELPRADSSVCAMQARLCTSVRPYVLAPSNRALRMREKGYVTTRRETTMSRLARLAAASRGVVSLVSQRGQSPPGSPLLSRRQESRAQNQRAVTPRVSPGP